MHSYADSRPQGFRGQSQNFESALSKCSTDLCTLMQIRDLKASQGQSQSFESALSKCSTDLCTLMGIRDLKASRGRSQSTLKVLAPLCTLMQIRYLKASVGSLKALRVHSQSAQRIYALLWGFETSRLPEGTLKALSKCSHIYTLSRGFEISRLPRAVSKLAHNTLKLLNT